MLLRLSKTSIEDVKVIVLVCVLTYAVSKSDLVLLMEPISMHIMLDSFRNSGQICGTAVLSSGRS